MQVQVEGDILIIRPETKKEELWLVAHHNGGNNCVVLTSRDEERTQWRIYKDHDTFMEMISKEED